MKILLTSTSFQDTPGKHHDALNKIGLDVDLLRGPITENNLLKIISNYDAVICGDDSFTEKVLEKGAKGNLKIISKYGVGLDKINLTAASRLGITITNCKGVNQHAVAEHVFGLMLTFYKNIHLEYNFTKNGDWIRLTGHELYNKKIGVIGLGSIGKEVVKRAKAFGLQIFGYDISLDKKFIDEFGINMLKSISEIFKKCEIITLHMNLTDSNSQIISESIINNIKNKPVVLINTARSDLIDMKGLIKGLDKGIIKAYLTDVLDIEPMEKNHPLKKYSNVIITPHIGSRTYQSVERQGLMAVENLLDSFQKNNLI